MINKVLEALKFASLNEMQEASLEAAKTGKDVVLLSPTGSGKTVGFLLPVLTKLDPSKPGVQALIIVPSRELAIQIEKVFRSMSTGFKVNCCYGGHDTKTEKNNLDEPPALLVGTPGRLAYHIRKNNFETGGVKTLVLDEFDKALEFGFQEDMDFIISNLKNIKQRILTSATEAIEIPAFTGIRKPIELNFLTDAIAPALTFKAVRASEKDKLHTLISLICTLGNKPTLVFCNHREAVERISEVLWKKGLSHGIFHGGLEQDDRERSLIKFRNGSHNILVTTDLAARGLDIPEIEYVLHYQMPVKEDAYIHRNGRTARMKAEGTSYLILSPEEKLPGYLNVVPYFDELPEKVKLPAPTAWETLYIGGGKKDKINKVDIVGLLLQKGELAKEDLGLIEVLDNASFVAVKRDKINKVIALVKNEKLKKKSVKIEIAN